MGKLKLDVQNKYNDFDKKEEVTRSKRETELLKLKQEFELKVKVSCFDLICIDWIDWLMCLLV